MTVTEEQLREIEERAEASTEGDLLWGMETFASREQALAKLAETLGRAESLEVHSVFRDDPDMSVFAAVTGNGPTSAANARFFAGARRVVLALIADLRLSRCASERWKTEALHDAGHVEHWRGRADRAEAAAAVMRDALQALYLATTHTRTRCSEDCEAGLPYEVCAAAASALAPDAGLAYSQRLAALEVSAGDRTGDALRLLARLGALEEVAEAARALDVHSAPIKLSKGADAIDAHVREDRRLRNVLRDALARLDALPARTGR